MHSTKPQPDRITPPYLFAKSSATLVKVTGMNFLNGCEGLVNDQPRPTLFRSAHKIFVDLTAADLAAPGNLQIRVRNPKGQVSSSSVALQVLPNGSTIPEVDPHGIAPAQLAAGTPGYQVEVTGNYFQDGCKALVNDQPRETLFVSGTDILVNLTAADLAAPANLVIRVRNPDGTVSSSYVVLQVI